ncbi:hypothetical protein BDQ17DRAFT_1377666 [Cyathus striatus]|nr:hypothetical protein BDQ17DRAFT_1377666 [Cyathus striatus]
MNPPRQAPHKLLLNPTTYQLHSLPSLQLPPPTSSHNPRIHTPRPRNQPSAHPITPSKKPPIPQLPTHFTTTA